MKVHWLPIAHPTVRCWQARLSLHFGNPTWRRLLLNVFSVPSTNWRRAGGAAEREACGGPSRSHLRGGHRPVQRNPAGGAVAWG